VTRAPLGPRWGYGPVVLIGTACATAAVLVAPSFARGLLWVGALTAVSVVAGLLLGSLERRALALAEAHRGTLDIMSRLIDSTERYAENHSRRVAELSVEVARALGHSESEVEDIRVAALLHDLCRYDFPADALAEAAGLPPEELEEIGVGIRSGKGGERDARKSLQEVVRIVACCLERWDGTGRRALRGGAIPSGARIIAVADAYDTAVTDRAYQKGRTPEEALAALQAASGTHFDPRVVEVFVRLHGAQPLHIATAA
jgi:HD-GYP domain-containing protein (c-di-GMP phosphodiesterase class II)